MLCKANPSVREAKQRAAPCADSHAEACSCRCISGARKSMTFWLMTTKLPMYFLDPLQ